MTIKCPKCQTENPETARFCLDCGTQLSSSKEIHPEVTETLQAPVRELTTGSTFAGRYQIIEELGRGGMGKVYKAQDAEIKEKVAIKLIKPEISADRHTVERFQNELKFARKIIHKNVGRMYDLGKEEGSYYITMEYVDGQDLKGMIRQSKQLTIGTAISIARQVSEGLAEAHRLGVVHRDLKPSNIMIDTEGNARIMDFGIARLLHAKSITGEGVTIGTPEYMSPEQVEGKEVDQRSDIYSLGIILYEILTGQVPFEGDTPFTVGVKHKSELPKDPHELNAQIPPDLSRLILKCLEKDKDRRYQSAEELDADLEKIEKGIPTTERVVPKAKPFTSREITVKFSLKKLLVPVLAAIGLIAAAIVLWRLIPKKEAAPAAPVENSVAVITFENQTGDPAYDYLQKAIPNLLITNLEQSGSFYVATWERLRDLFKQVKKGDLGVIDPDSGFEICRRDGIKAIVLGTYTKAGNVFVTDVKVLDVATKKLVKSASTKGEGVDSILRSQIDDLGREIAQGLGAAFQAGQRKVVDVTTTSLEAYNVYLKGLDEYDKFNNDQARKFLEKAVELDPSFARAHHVLAYVYYWLGQSEAAGESLKKAMALRDKITEKERLTIEADYAQTIEHDQDKYFRLQKQAAEKYPKEKRIRRELGTSYVERGDLDRAEQEFRATLALDPEFSPALLSLSEVMVMRGEYAQALELRQRWASLSPGNPDALDALGCVYFLLGESDEALAKFKEALMFVPGYLSSVVGLQYMCAQREDYGQALAWLGQLLSEGNPPRSQREGRLWKAFYCSWLGKHEEALAELREITTLSPYGAQALDAWIWYDRGRADQFWKNYQDSINAFLRTSPEMKHLTMADVQFGQGLAALRQGQLGSARQRLAEMKSLVPKLPKLEYWTEWQKEAASKRDLLSAEICLAEGKPKEAIAILQKATPRPCPFSFYFTEDWLRYNFPFEQDTLARAYAQNGEPEKAMAEYERLTTYNPKSDSRSLIHPRYYYRLAKLYEQRGQMEKAAAQYQKFLVLWKDADTGLPEIEDARNRLAGLE